MGIISASQLNERARKFYADQQREMERRMEDPIVWQLTVQTVDSEARKLPRYWQRSFEVVSKEVEELVRAVNRHFASKGGSARKPDALQKLIEKLVEVKPRMTAAQLLDKLKSGQFGDVVADIDEELISYWSDGRIKEASISGLKDRLTRARKSVLGKKNSSR